MRFTRTLSVLVAGSMAAACALFPTITASAHQNSVAPVQALTGLNQASGSDLDRFLSTHVQGTLIKTILDFPAVLDSPESDPSELSGQVPDGSSVTAGEQHTQHEDIDYAVRVGDVDLPVENTDGALSEIASGSEVRLAVEVPTTTVEDSDLSTGEVASALPLTTDQASEITDFATEPLAVSEVVSVKAAIAATNTGNHKLYVALPQRSSSESQAVTVAEAEQLIADAGAYWSQQTRNKVTGFKSIKVTTYKTSMSLEQLCAVSKNDNRQKIWAEGTKKTGYKKAARTHLLVLTEQCPTPKDPEKSQALGVAEIGASLATGGRVITNDRSLHTLVHEFGHNFSLGHANLRSIYEDYEEEYRGFFSPMSATVGESYGAIPALDVAYQHKLGIVGSSHVSRIAGTTTVRLNPVSSTKQKRGVYFYDPYTGSRVFVEYRSGTESDQSAYYLSTALSEKLSSSSIQLRLGAGVRVYFLQEDDYLRYNDTGTLVSPSGSSVLRTTLRAGESLTHHLSDFKVTVKEIANGTATVSIKVPRVGSVTKAAKASSKHGTPAVVKTSVTTNVPSGGKVVATVNGKTVGSADVKLKSGKRTVKVKLSKKLSVGTHKVKLRYSGDASAKASSKTVKVTVKKATPKAKITVKDPYFKSSPTATVTLSSGVAPTGKVALTLDGKKVSSKKLKNGSVSFKLPSTLKKGKHSLKATYAGTKNYKAVTVNKSFTVAVKKGKISGLRSGTAEVVLGKTYKDTFTVNHTAKLQKKTGSAWKTVKTLKAGTHVLKYKAAATPKKTSYRVVITGTSTVKAAKSKTITLKTVSN